MKSKKGPTGEDVDPNLIEQVYDLMGAMDTLRDQVLRELALTKPQAEALWTLRQQAEPSSMRRLAAALRCDPGNITFIADRLEERGLIKRVNNESDRRVKLIAVTPAGRAVQRRLVRAAAKKSPLTALSADEQRQMTALLAKVLGEEITQPS